MASVTVTWVRIFPPAIAPTFAHQPPLPAPKCRGDGEGENPILHWTSILSPSPRPHCPIIVVHHCCPSLPYHRHTTAISSYFIVISWYFIVISWHFHRGRRRAGGFWHNWIPCYCSPRPSRPHHRPHHRQIMAHHGPSSPNHGIFIVGEASGIGK